MTSIKKNENAIIVGAGIGGLAAAIDLRLNNFEVSVFEKLDKPGGRCHQTVIDGFKFDTGPTMLMMKEELESLFEKAGRRMEDYLKIKRLDPHSCFHFADGRSLRFTSDRFKLKQEFEAFEKGAGDNIDRWLADQNLLYEVGMKQFIDRNSPNYLSALKPDNLSLLLKGMVTAPLYTSLGRYFQDQRLKDALAFSSLYIGLNPYNAPSIYNVLPCAELKKGLYFPEGGMYSIAEALTRLAQDIGVKIRCNTRVKGFNTEQDRLVNVLLEDGDRIECDLAVVNADLPEAYESILSEKHPLDKKFSYSCGAYLFFLGMEKIPMDLMHHQVFLPFSFETSMQQLFEENRVPDEPVFYLSCPTRTDSCLAPPGKHAVTILVPVPSRPLLDTTEDTALGWNGIGNKLFSHIMKRLESANLSLDEKDVLFQIRMNPEEQGQRFGLKNDAAFGLSHRLSLMGPMRPRNKHHRIANLYFAGASTHPGNGIPMVIKSGRLVTQRILQDRMKEAI
ncbi:MAG: phytoene desaturase family protein [Cyanobacteriota/Melainabacteria group bacterium]